ncbi:MAG TPA: exodeoxyribonuclease V subunit gamma [Acidimicrobiia bacterium]|nr:exodeoxyribonuclease V subunit gamma [Acidimicrobiia bacterium]
MAVRIHVAPHPDALVAMLCDQLANPVGDLFSTEMVVVPSRGIERWLTQQIAAGMAERGAGDGICANVEFPSPRRVVGRVLGAEPALARSADSWESPALTAHLLEAIDDNRTESWMSLVARYLDEKQGGSSANRMVAAAKMARLYSRYARRRPVMIRHWQKSEDVGPGGEPLSPDTTWQAELWRAVRQKIGVPSLPELLPAGLDPIRRGEVDPGLPERLAVYGLTTTDPLDLDVLVALGGTREVNLFVLHPSPALWTQVEASLTPVVLPDRVDDPTVDLANHPLLETWGRDSREFQTVLGAVGLTGPPMEKPASDDTLLGRLQADIHANRPPRFDRRLAEQVRTRQDRSVQVHVCHGARRQAEVMRDAILHVLATNPGLEPRDVVIMTPDLATFAPLMEAAFPRHEGGGLPDLRLRIADRSPAATNPLVGFTAWLLEAAGSRLEAAVVRELVDRPVVREKFHFDGDTAGAISSLVDDAHVAWGLDVDHRREWGVDAAERTWRRGLDRTLAGVFYADDPTATVGGLSPLEGVEGQEAVPAGILAALLDRLVATREATSRPRPLSEWAGVIAQSVRMLAAPAWGEEWQLDQLERLLGETFPAGDDVDPDIALGEVRQAVSEWTEDRPSPLHFRSGDITVCTLVPMRSVPYRVVALLGMDEDRFPRRGRGDGDDLLADHELMGDSHPASQDRQLLLDAVLAAGDHLLVSYSGADEITNAEVPPAVPVAELTDALSDMVGDEAMKRVETHHPLQSFSEANFRAGALGVAGPWGFDATQFEGALAIQHRTFGGEGAPPEWPLPDEDEAVRLKDLIGFLHNPVGRFVRSRLGFSIPEPGDLPDDTIPSDLDSLGSWSVANRILAGLIAGADLDGLRERERGSDALPPGRLGDDDLEDALATATSLWEASRARGYDPKRHRPYAGSIATARGIVEGTVNADAEQAHVATVSPSNLKAKQRLDGWVRMLFLTALQPDVAWKALLLGKKSGKPWGVTIGPLEGDAGQRQERALELLGELVDLYREGHRRPLPLPCDVAFQWQRHGGASGDRSRFAAREEFESRWGDANNPAHVMVLPHVRSFRALEETEFVDFCERLWGPLLHMSRERAL